MASDRRHVRVRELFLAACELSGAERRVFLAHACGDDQRLRREVESLLVHHDDRATVAQPGSDHGPARDAGRRFEAGDVFAGRYRVVAELGHGGMGEVLRAHDLVLDQPVAIKLLTPSGGPRDKVHLTALLNEVRLARQVTHPNVCRVFDFGEAEGETFLTMEYVDGEDLASLLARIGRLPQDKLLDVARQLAGGLAAAHARGVLHRDLKPANVLIDGRGRVRITDFGIASGGAHDDGIPAGAVAGTPAYMAPEQATGGEVSAASDLYSLGLVLHEMATGRPVFEAENRAAYAELHRTSTPAPPSRQVRHLDPALEAVILRCLEKDPRDRPASARAVLAELPGGDPLQLALAAGDTPSPEAVAAAPSWDVAPAPGHAASLLAALFLLLAGLWVLGDAAYPGRAPWAPAPPEVLAERCATILHDLGHRQAPRDRAWGFQDVLDRTHEETGVFWYRQSPELLKPYHLGTIYYARVDFEDPPPTDPGVRMLIGPAGKLLMLHVTPDPDGEREDDAAQVAVDWAPLLAAAGLDAATLEAAEPETAPPVFAEVRAAWTAADRQQPIEAAAAGGRVVYFDARDPPDDGGERIDFTALWDVYLAASDAFWLLLVLAAIVLAWRNLKAGRGDLRGARSLAALVVAVDLTVWLLEADHVPDVGAELFRLQATLGRVLLDAAVAWLAYVALEPTVRRFKPRALIAWNRVLRGRPTDPLVGRSLLTGAVVGAAWALLTLLDRLLTRWLDLEGAGEIFILPQLETALAGRLAFASVLSSGAGAASWGVLDLFFLVALRALLKRWWPAVAIFVAVNGVLETLEGIHPAVSWLTLGAGIAGVTAFVLVRFGLLTYAAALFCYFVLIGAPISFDFGAWYAETGLAALALVGVLGVFGFRVALAGRPFATDLASHASIHS